MNQDTQLNLQLQATVNPPAESKPQVPGPNKTVFRLGDSVAATVNEYDASGARTLTNGARGVVTGVLKGSNEVEVRFFSDCPTQWISTMSHKVEHAYAATVHRLQGQEAPSVVLLLDMWPGRQNRASLYSGCTRAKRDVRIYATQANLEAALADRGKVYRRTRLAERLRRLRAAKRAMGE